MKPTQPLFMDISGIDREGLEDFYWPVSVAELRQMRDRLLHGVATLVRQARAEAQPGGDEVLTLAHFFIKECLQCFQAQLLVDRTRDSGFVPLAAQYLPLWSAMIENTRPAPWLVLQVLSESFSLRALADVLAKPGNLLRNFLARMVFVAPNAPPLPESAGLSGVATSASLKKVIHSRPLTSRRLEQEIVSTKRDQPWDIISRHARECGEPVTLAHHKYWFGPVAAAEAAHQVNRLKDCPLLDETLAVVVGAWTEAGVPMGDLVRDHLAEILIKTMAVVACHLQRLERHPKRLPMRLWTGTCGNLWDRMLRIVARRHGGHVTGHSHAGGSYIYRAPELYSNEFLACDRFVTCSEGRAALLRRNAPGQVLFEPTLPEICGLSKPEPPSAAEARSAGHPLGLQGLRVMLVMNIFLGDTMSFSPHMGDKQALDWLGRLSGRLASWGSHLILKPHPEGPCRPPSGLAEAIGAALISQNFEQVLDQADVFLYDFPCSTTLKHAMASGKPIVLVDFGYFDPDPVGQKDLEGRCAVIRGWFDDRNRAQVDWAEFQAALARAGFLAGDRRFYDTYLR